ncbi:hypothetical protein HMPREF1502_4694 [Klebsiella sp. AS10]|nr:hypothetical protein A225_4502 [Klebsiella michiganensis E718]EUB35325.1 hypothetical protein HMPREF1502_4694 [Klebsiella sp. AS10]
MNPCFPHISVTRNKVKSIDKPGLNPWRRKPDKRHPSKTALVQTDA